METAWVSPHPCIEGSILLFRAAGASPHSPVSGPLPTCLPLSLFTKSIICVGSPRTFLSIPSFLPAFSLSFYFLRIEMALLKWAAAGVASDYVIQHDSNLNEGAIVFLASPTSCRLLCVLLQGAQLLCSCCSKSPAWLLHRKWNCRNASEDWQLSWL